jgi:hypothetical protein
MPELTGKLDTLVNGPEGLPSFDGDAWEHVDWHRHEEQVRRLRGRIEAGKGFTPTGEGTPQGGGAT